MQLKSDLWFLFVQDVKRHTSLWMCFLNGSLSVSPQLMSKSSEKPRLRQIPSEDMDSEDSSAGDAHQDRVRAESQRELENQEEQLNLQHALLLNQVKHKPPNLKQTCRRRISHTPLVVPKTSAKMLSHII